MKKYKHKNNVQKIRINRISINNIKSWKNNNKK